MICVRLKRPKTAVIVMSKDNAPTPKLLNSLEEGGTLERLVYTARRISHYQKLLESKLSVAARPHCKFSFWKDGELLVLVTDGQWATTLRYQQRRLVRELSTIPEFAGLVKIVFRVEPADTTYKREREANVITEAAAESIKEAAEAVTDARLKAALERLSSRAKKRD